MAFHAGCNGKMATRICFLMVQITRVRYERTQQTHSWPPHLLVLRNLKKSLKTPKQKLWTKNDNYRLLSVCTESG